MPQDIPTPEGDFAMMDWREIPFSTKVQNESFMMSHECSPATTVRTPPHPGLGGVQFCINGESYADRVFQHEFPLTCVQDWRIANHVRSPSLSLFLSLSPPSPPSPPSPVGRVYPLDFAEGCTIRAASSLYQGSVRAFAK